MSVGDRIRFVRKFRKMTQAELAKKIGVTQKCPHARIAQYENGFYNPSKETILEISHALSINPEYLFDFDPGKVDDVVRFFFELDRLYGVRLVDDISNRFFRIYIEDKQLATLLTAESKKLKYGVPKQYIEHMLNYSLADVMNDQVGSNDGHKD